MTDILATEKPKYLKLADGKEYILSPLNLNTMAELETEFNCNLIDIAKQLYESEGFRFSTMRKILHILLKANHNLSIEEVGNLVHRDNLKDVSDAIVKIWTGE